MDERPVVFIDSGVGGLPYCGEFARILPMESIVYVADRENFPYGPKSKKELSDLLAVLVARLVIRMDPKLVVIACNTASVSALADLRAAFPNISIVGTVPAVKPAALSSKTGRIGILATERTISDQYSRHLVERFAPECAVEGIAAPELVEFVENDFIASSRAERESMASNYIERFRALGVDSLVLGCTHFLYLAEEFAKAAGGDMKVFDSRAGVAERAASLLQARGTTGERVLYVTGTRPLEESWHRFAGLFRIGSCLLLDDAR